MASIFAKPAAAVAAALMGAMTLAPAAASAQSYGYGPAHPGSGYGHDRCRTYDEGRTGAGALIGGGIGAVAGSQIAGRGNRTEGSIIGGVLGAVIGAQVGRASNDDCREYRDHGRAYDRHADRAYGYGHYERRHGRHGDRYGDRRYENGYEVSADGYYYYDPRRGWLPR